MAEMMIEGVAIPAMWAICDDCGGEGHNSRQFGAMTSSEFVECFDDEESRADYFAGKYDRRCECCRGSGKVMTPDPSRLTFAHKRALVEARWAARADAQDRAAQRAEARMCGEW